MKTGKILPRQLAILLTVGAVPPLLLMRAPGAVWTAIPAVLPVGAVLLCPAAAWVRREPAQSPAQWVSAQSHRGLGRALAMLYAAFLLLAGVETTARLGLLLRATELPNPMLPGLLVLLGVAAAYGVWMGIESAARTCGLLAVGGVLLLILLGGTLRTEWSPEQLRRAMNPGDSASIRAGVRLLGSLSPSVVLLTVLGPWSGAIRARRIGALWTVWIGLAAGLATLCIGVLGDWAARQVHPLYAAALTAPHGTLLRPAGVFGTLLILGAYARLMGLLTGFTMCMQAFDARFVRAAACPLGAGVCVAVGAALMRHAPMIDVLTALQTWCAPGIVVGVPLIVGCIRRRKERTG